MFFFIFFYFQIAPIRYPLVSASATGSL